MISRKHREVAVDAAQERRGIEGFALARPGRRRTFGEVVRRGLALDDVEELIGLDRLGDVPVHARGQAAIAVTVHGMGRHGDDRDPPPRLRLAEPDGGRGLHPVHHGHLDVHQDHVEPVVLQHADRLLAVAGHLDLVPAPLEEADRQLLVDGVVLDQEQAERLAATARGLGRAGGRGVAARPRTTARAAPTGWRPGGRKA